jgi:hypothetical protein
METGGERKAKEVKEDGEEKQERKKKKTEASNRDETETAGEKRQNAVMQLREGS